MSGRSIARPCFTIGMLGDHSTRASTDPIFTSRLVLTPIGPRDVKDLSLLYHDSQVAYWTGPWTPTTVTSWTADMAERWVRDGVGKWMVRDRSDASLIGRGGFSLVEVDGEKVLELGWAVRDSRTGRGYATELGTAALHWAARYQPDLPIVAFTEVHNRASRAVAERLGMHTAGIIQRAGLVEGQSGIKPDAPFALYRLRPRKATEIGER
jgi:RimJ/RimL family protein N-acetyltransferase